MILVAALTVGDAPCPWDCAGPDQPKNSVGIVGVIDMLALLGQWEQVGVSCDYTGTPGVGTIEFLELIGRWGPCPTCSDAGDCDDGNPCTIDACVAGECVSTPASGDCCEANGTPGCNEPTCCSAVCALDAFCCDTTWDTMCVEQAVTSCGCAGGDTCGSPTAGSCCVANVTPACNDLDCCEFVCDVIDAFCCDVEWDAVCAQTAGQVCLGCP
jgi:hypothetical protein